MQLKIKLLKWSAGLPVAMLNEKTAEKIGVHPRDMLNIKTFSKHPREIAAVVDVIKGLVGTKEIAISSELKKHLGVKIGESVEVNMLIPPISMDFIKKKFQNKPLSKKEMDAIIRDVMNNSLSESEIALFVSAMDKYGMTMKETIFLINAIQKTGTQLKFRNKFVVDKHSIGGVPGNRTTPIIVSICAAAGLIMPKNSSRAITSAAGTADVIETIAKVEFSIKEVKKIIKKTNACMIWGGAIGMVPADSKIIRIEKLMKIDPEAQLLASIMSKKLAMGSKYILIDIPYGKEAKVDNRKKALKLKRKFEYLGKYFKKNLKCLLTDGSQPIGSGIGPVLELEDIIKILNPKEKGPSDLEKKSLLLAGKLFEMTGKAKKGEGIKMAEEILVSGKAFEKFKEIIEAQGGSLKKLKKAEFTRNIKAKKSGTIIAINNKKINSLAREAGCPIDKSAGIYLHAHVGEKIKKGDTIITLHAETSSRLNHATRYYRGIKPIRIK
ncbi:MAG TPA: AMP phosphorylase [Bacillota bacterium]|nr:AMP phosphorylase [Bacillota bacterium]